MPYHRRRPSRVTAALLAGAAGIGSALGGAAPLRAQGDEPARVHGQISHGYYEEGVRLRESGEWEAALDLWEEAHYELSVDDLYDPRIGLAFLELAVEQGAEGRYPRASQILLWGFSGTSFEGLEETVQEELDRLAPLLGPEAAAEWQALMDAGDGSLLLEIKRYWVERDPTPSTDLNERLIEHAERIQYAREHYRFNRLSPYDTDDRGTVYVRFGPPDKRQSGMLGASEMELRIRIPQIEDRARMRNYDVWPQYAVWVYDSLDPEAFTYFLFGNEDGNGPFQLVEGVHDLIPSAARNRGSSRYNPGGIPMEYYLELFYYEDLSAIGGYFGRRFSELAAEWNKYTFRNPSDGPGQRAAPRESTLDSYSLRFQQIDEYMPESSPKVPFLSEVEEAPAEELVVQPVRVIRENEPQLIIAALSSPRFQVERPSRNADRIDLPGYWMRHSLIVRDEALTEVGRLHQRVTSVRGDVSTFTLRHPLQPIHLTVMAETLEEGSQEPIPAPPFPGRVHVQPDPPLSTDPTVFEMSDLVLGVEVPEGVDDAAMPFAMLPTDRIWRQDPLKVYFELYHLAVDDQGVGRFQASFRVVPLNDDGSVDSSREPITLVPAPLESRGATFTESFVIDLRDQKFGRYRLEVDVQDLRRNARLQRSAELQLIG